MAAVTPEKIRRDAEHAVRIGRTYLMACERFGLDLRRARVMELGAGWNLGAILMLGCHGAHVVAAEPGMVSWQESYHRPFYEMMMRILSTDFTWSQLELFRRVLEPGGYPQDRVTALRTNGEKLDAIATDSIDFVGSNAVLEHVRDVSTCLRELHRITKPGGFGAHQIDLRDHRNFARPVDYMLQTEAEFSAHINNSDGNSNKNGNRMRQRHFEAEFASSGFHLDAVEQNMFSALGYRDELADLMNKAGIPFIDEDLRVLGIRVYVQKPPPAKADHQSEWCRMGASGERYLHGREPDAANAARAETFIADVHRTIAAIEHREAIKDRLKKIPGLHAAVRTAKKLRG